MSDLSCLIEQEIPRLRRYARALAHATDRTDELVQDTLVRALSNLHLWQSGTELRAWLFTIMHNQFVNTVRLEARERTTVDIEHVSSTLTATTDPTVRRQLIELDRALALLPNEQREVVLLVGLKGLPAITRTRKTPRIDGEREGPAFPRPAAASKEPSANGNKPRSIRTGGRLND
jgi:RNA polymerase sigma factor (sigma-70 family)